MVFKIVIKPLALLEIDDTVLYYENQLKELSKRFLFALDDCQQNKRQPDHYLIISFPVRRILLKKFPYKLLYFVSDNHEVVIIALVHTKRSNHFIKKSIMR